MTDTTQLGLNVHLDTDFDTAIEKVTAALKTEGFGVLTSIDVKATLKTKIDVDFRPYTILGACNPKLAYRALNATPEVGLMLPCNVTVSAAENGGMDVSIVDPRKMMDVVDHPDLCDVADEAREKLVRVVELLKEEA